MMEFNLSANLYVTYINILHLWKCQGVYGDNPGSEFKKCFSGRALVPTLTFQQFLPGVGKIHKSAVCNL